MVTDRRDGAQTIVNESFPWLGEDRGYRIADAYSQMLAHLFFARKEKAYDRVGRGTLRRVSQFCKKNDIDLTQDLVTIKNLTEKENLTEKGGFLEGNAKVKSRSTDYMYNVRFEGFIKQTDDSEKRRKSLRNIRVYCGCHIPMNLRKKPVPENFGDLYGDNRPPESRKVSVPICFHGHLTIYELTQHYEVDGYDQWGLGTQTNDFAKYEARRIFLPMANRTVIRSEIRRFHLKTNFFNPLRKILGVPLLV